MNEFISAVLLISIIILSLLVGISTGFNWGRKYELQFNPTRANQVCVDEGFCDPWNNLMRNKEGE